MRSWAQSTFGDNASAVAKMSLDSFIFGADRLTKHSGASLRIQMTLLKVVRGDRIVRIAGDIAELRLR